MNPVDLRTYHLLLKECGLGEDDKLALLQSFSEGNATSSTELEPAEAQALLKYLKEVHAQKCKPMRGKIIHYLTLLGYVTGNDTPDWKRIDEFIKNIGSNNPRKVILNYLYASELPAVVTQVQAMYRNESKRASK